MPCPDCRHHTGPGIKTCVTSSAAADGAAATDPGMSEQLSNASTCTRHPGPGVMIVAASRVDASSALMSKAEASPKEDPGHSALRYGLRP